MKAQQRILVLQTPMVKIFLDSTTTYYMEITCTDGSIIEHEPFKGLEGLVAALSLSAEICAGKFMLKKLLMPTPDAPITIDFNKKKGG
jgi:hypothetical protein